MANLQEYLSRHNTWKGWKPSADDTLILSLYLCNRLRCVVVVRQPAFVQIPPQFNRLSMHILPSPCTDTHENLMCTC